MPRLIGGNKINELGLQQAVFIAVNKPGRKGDRDIVAVLMVYHISGVKGITVAEEALSLFQHIFFVVYIIFDLSGLKPGQFDLPVPVPQKGSLLIRADGFLAYVDRKFKISVLFDLFLVLFRVYLHGLSPFPQYFDKILQYSYCSRG